MKVFEDNFVEYFEDKTIIALGGFDGLHLGHRALIEKTIHIAKRLNCKSMIFTFKNHPLSIINEEAAPKLLMSNQYKQELLAEYNIEILNMAEFHAEFMKLSPEEYISNLVKHYNASGLVVGFNHRFGYKNLGDIDLLKDLSKTLGFNLYVVPPVKYKGEIVSSSKIRNLLSEDGDIEKANKMLSRYYTLEGEIIRGKQLGRKLGFPTVNLDYSKEYVLPRGGVYFSIVEHNNKKYKGITNIGYNPTVENHKLSIETHIIDFNQELYNEKIKIYFVKRIRDEKKFNSLTELSEQLKNDKIFALKQKIEKI